MVPAPNSNSNLPSLNSKLGRGPTRHGTSGWRQRGSLHAIDLIGCTSISDVSGLGRRSLHTLHRCRGINDESGQCAIKCEWRCLLRPERELNIDPGFVEPTTFANATLIH
eukprot:TRINITY_DN6495_c0_g1_i5.p2 TRINITY_DN6495_c0_g1~~TRINITY_DN6495_c0_g1_i5.p2  ORF type:complete len:110 (-),score=6.00 TRINITY_DN6495_c0_g1_i5:273-602(-)